jgi:hypothetical protein
MGNKKCHQNTLKLRLGANFDGLGQLHGRLRHAFL